MNDPADLGKAHLRVVRSIDDLAANVKFYRDGLGFEVLSEFKDHDGFDAVMLGRKEAAYHLAFVHMKLPGQGQHGRGRTTSGYTRRRTRDERTDSRRVSGRRG